MVISLRTKHRRNDSLEHERHIINNAKVEQKLDDINNITVDPKTKKLTVKINGKSYTLKEDV